MNASAIVTLMDWIDDLPVEIELVAGLPGEAGAEPVQPREQRHNGRNLPRLRPA